MNSPTTSCFILKLRTCAQRHEPNPIAQHEAKEIENEKFRS